MPDPQSSASIPQGPFLRSNILQREDEKLFLLDFIERSDGYRQPFSWTWDEFIENYMVAPASRFDRIFPKRNLLPPELSGRAYGSSSQLKDPETHQVVETLASQGIGLLMGNREYLQAIPIGRDDPEKARFLSRLLMAVMEQPGNFRTQYQLFKDSYIFGTSILEMGWEKASRAQVTPTGSIQQVQYKNGVYMRSVDIYDFYPDPSGTRIQHDMEFVAKRFRISASEAMSLANQGVYSKEAVNRAIASARAKTGRKEGGVGDTRFPYVDTTLPAKYLMLVGFEGWGRVPFKPLDGHNNRVITLLENEVVRSHINPFFDGNIPFHEVVVNPIAGRFYGLSPVEVIRFLQDSADNLLMVFNDAADMAAHVPLLVGNAFGGDPNRLMNRTPLSLIQCANPDAVKPVPIDLNALQFAAGDMMRRKLSIREASGATNPTQAIPSGGRQTATEISELTRAASQRVELMVQLFERDDFPWLGRGIHSRLRQFMGRDDVAIATLAGEQFKVRLQDIDFDADVWFTGSRFAESRFQKVLKYEKFLNLVGANPGIVMQFPEIVTEYLRDALGFKDAEQIVQRATEQQQMQQIVQAITGSLASGEATGAAGGGGSDEEDLGTEAQAVEQAGEQLA